MAGVKLLQMCGLALNYFAGLDAAGADAHALARTIDLSFHRLQVHVPATAGRVVSVRDVIAELRTLAAKITFLCHDEILQSRIAETPLVIYALHKLEDTGKW